MNIFVKTELKLKSSVYARLWMCSALYVLYWRWITLVILAVINAWSFCHSQPHSHQPSSQNLWKHQGLETEKWFFFSTVCHRWWESLCNANIISHCVSLALQFTLCTKQPSCAVIYQNGEKKTSLGLRWKGYVVGRSCRSACCDWARLDFIDSVIHPALCAAN